MTFQTNFKPSRTARKKARVVLQRETDAKERQEKAKVRKRDKRCRFPLCGCRALGLRLEVSHDEHKGGHALQVKRELSVEPLMVYLCVHRHQDGRISRHRGTMRAVYLTEDGYNGPVAWHVDAAMVRAIAMNLSQQDRREFEKIMTDDWYEVARERAVQELEPLSILQLAVLKKLEEMDL